MYRLYCLPFLLWNDRIAGHRKHNGMKSGASVCISAERAATTRALEGVGAIFFGADGNNPRLGGVIGIQQHKY